MRARSPICRSTCFEFEEGKWYFFFRASFYQVWENCYQRDAHAQRRRKPFLRRFGEIADENGLQKKLIETCLRKKTSSLYGWFMVYDRAKINSPAAHILFLREFLFEKRAKSRSTRARVQEKCIKNYYWMNFILKRVIMRNKNSFWPSFACGAGKKSYKQKQPNM